jgi:hypothetical protein
MGRCVDRGCTEAMRAFRDRWYKGENVYDAVALHVRHVIVWSKLVRGGGLEVNVEVVGIKDHQRHGLFSRYSRKGHGIWVLVEEDSKPSD